MNEKRSILIIILIINSRSNPRWAQPLQKTGKTNDNPQIGTIMSDQREKHNSTQIHDPPAK
jgi:hypothetical protein